MKTLVPHPFGLSRTEGIGPSVALNAQRPSIRWVEYEVWSLAYGNDVVGIQSNSLTISNVVAGSTQNTSELVTLKDNPPPSNVFFGISQSSYRSKRYGLQLFDKTLFASSSTIRRKLLTTIKTLGFASVPPFVRRSPNHLGGKLSRVGDTTKSHRAFFCNNAGSESILRTIGDYLAIALPAFSFPITDRVESLCESLVTDDALN